MLDYQTCHIFATSCRERWFQYQYDRKTSGKNNSAAFWLDWLHGKIALMLKMLNHKYKLPAGFKSVSLSMITYAVLLLLVSHLRELVLDGVFFLDAFLKTPCKDLLISLKCLLIKKTGRRAGPRFISCPVRKALGTRYPGATLIPNIHNSAL